VPVQVSYKKQFVLMSMLVITLLTVVELGANVWLYYFYRCDFENTEIFKEVKKSVKREMCLETLETDFRKESLTNLNLTKLQSQNPNTDILYFNNENFRGDDFSLAKSENTFRIFTLGGSTTFGIGVFNNQTWPFYLQNLYDKTNLGVDVEVINTGKPGWGSVKETNLIKERLLNFEADLFIVSDGWNDVKDWKREGIDEASPTKWKENWAEICDMGKQFGYDTIITLQPMIHFSKKIFTEQESEYYLEDYEGGFSKNFLLYVEQLPTLDSHCTQTGDLRNIFDNSHEPIFFDAGHVGPRGNQIIAENMYKLSLPIVINRTNENLSKNYLDDVSDEKFPAHPSDESISFMEETYIVIEDIIFQYKTPRILPLIFQQ